MTERTNNLQRVRTTTNARVRLTIEVPVGSWGPACQLDQVYRQAIEEAVGKVRRLIEPVGCRVVGTVDVEAITTSLEGCKRDR